MNEGAHPRKLPLWMGYLRAVAIVFLALLLVDWIAFALWGKWIGWPYLAGVAVVWPAIVTAIT
jgi:hypothetical protein